MADTSELMLRLEKIKRIDMRVAVDVAGIANMQVRDVMAICCLSYGRDKV